jgi:regulator of sigma E protease
MLFLHTVLSFIVILSVVVFIHELGHYLVARLVGVRVEAFSIGFGKELFGFNDRHGTRWKFALIPMGGYVKMFGDASEASTADAGKLDAMSAEERAVSFHHKSLPRKAAIVTAGPLANFVLTVAVFTWTIFTVGLPTTEPVVGEVTPGTPAAQAGLKAGDRILKIDETTIGRFMDIPTAILTNTGTEVTLLVARGDKEFLLAITPELREEKDGLGNKIKRPILGIVSQKLTYGQLGFFPSLWEAVKQTGNIVTHTFDALGQILSGERSAKEMSGPLGIAQLSGQVTQQGLGRTLGFIALLSTSLGLINLFPIPPLDGGHLLYYTLEGMRGRPVAQKFQDLGFKFGFALLLCLMALVTFHDIQKLLTKS